MVQDAGTLLAAHTSKLIRTSATTITSCSFISSNPVFTRRLMAWSKIVTSGSGRTNSLSFSAAVRRAKPPPFPVLRRLLPPFDKITAQGSIPYLSFCFKILFGIFRESFLAARCTEVIGYSFVIVTGCGFLFIHRHFAYRINGHFSHLLSISSNFLPEFYRQL
jgi:hypothetical protein